MADLFLQIAVSLDGYIEDARQGIDWMVVDESIDPTMTATLQSIDGMIFGRKAHELMHQFWPTAAAMDGASPDLIEQARLMNALPKYVLTHGAERTGWTNAHAITVADVPRLKSEAHRPLALYAGAGAAQSLIDHVDEIRLIQYPVLLGAGTPLFARDDVRRDYRFVDTQSFASGATLTRFRKA